MDIFARRGRYARSVLDQTGARCFVGKFCGCLAIRISLHERSAACVLPGSRGLDGYADLPVFRRRFLMDFFWSCAIAGAGRELPSDRGITLRCCRTDWTLRCDQRQLDAYHANDGAAREPAAAAAGGGGGGGARGGPLAAY